MATNIDRYLNQIRTAVYGKQVRSAIADGIEECYNRDIRNNPLIIKKKVLAEEFDASKNYSKGKLVYYEGDIYIFTSDHSAGAWKTDNPDAIVITLADAINEKFEPIADDITDLQNEKADKADTVLDTTLSRGRKADTTVGLNSFAFGEDVTASHRLTAAFGFQTVAGSMMSFATGRLSQATGRASHAEGESTTASGACSHAEGYLSVASQSRAHAEGESTTASGSQSHAEGGSTTASGNFSHAEGYYSVASGSYCHAEGSCTISNHRAQHVFGECNVEDNSAANSNIRGTYVEIVGNGANTNNRSNARTLDWNGNERLAGDLTLNMGTNNEVSVLTALTTLQNQMADLLYEAIKFNSCTVTPSLALIGTTVSSVTIAWDLNKLPTTLKLDNVAVPSNKLIQNGSMEKTGTWTATTTFTMAATDERDTAITSKPKLTFTKNVYYGVANLNNNPNSAFVTGLTSELRTNKKPSFTVNAGTNKYVYYAVPTSYGACTFAVGGFSGGFEAAKTVSVTYPNTSHTENYYVYRSTNNSLGSTTITVS